MAEPLLEHLRDLHNHMAWADAEWFRLWEQSGCQDDPELLERAGHSADVQAAFLMVLRGDPVAFPPEGESRFPERRARTRAQHGALQTLLANLRPDDLARPVTIPWFPGPPCQVTVAEALTQVALHTQHHRGQLMSRLKALGGRPGNVDYLIWVWKGRPASRW